MEKPTSGLGLLDPLNEDKSLKHFVMEIEAPNTNHPEAELIAAVVRQAMYDVLANRPLLKGEKAAARDWLFSDEEHDFSFLWCLEVLGINRRNVIDGIRGYCHKNAGKMLYCNIAERRIDKKQA